MTAKLFPKLFIGDAAVSFKRYLKKNNYNYSINSIQSRGDLIALIERVSAYKNYTIPVILDDISFLNQRDQSILLKFMDDTNLKLILLASRDNILSTIISRVREFRKFYVSLSRDKTGCIKINKARDMYNNDQHDDSDEYVQSQLSVEDRLKEYCKYNPLLFYDDSLVEKFSSNDRLKLLSMLESQA